jgi:hypothetical protein
MASASASGTGLGLGDASVTIITPATASGLGVGIGSANAVLVDINHTFDAVGVYDIEVDVDGAFRPLAMPTIQEQDSLHINVTVWETEDRENRQNLSGATIKWEMKNAASFPVKLEKTLAGGGINAVDLTNGEFEVVIDAGDTDGFGDIDMFHRAYVETDSDSRSTVFTGEIEVKDP